MKYVVVSGGVVSGLGKGISISSLGVLLKASGLRVSSLKIDPYLNVDAGTMSPFEHGEVFVLDDGGEADLDLGNYERFLNVRLSREHNITTGKVYQQVISAERRGDYLGKTVQLIPHITDAIQDWIERVAHVPVDGSGMPPDVCMIEVGGTVGDIESLVFLEALRQFQFRVGRDNIIFFHVSLVPVLGVVGEQKTKPTQHTVKELRSHGINPDVLICRSEHAVSDSTRAKLAQFCHVPPQNVLTVYDVSNIYHVPLIMHEQGAIDIMAAKFKLPISSAGADLDAWNALAHRVDIMTDVVKIALVGKYTGLSDSYLSVIKALRHAGVHINRKVQIDWIEASQLESPARDVDSQAWEEAWETLKGADGILVPGGFGDRGVEGKILAVNYARTHKVPFLGVCLGMQCAVIEYARNVLGWEGAHSTEFEKDAPHKVVIFMPEINPVTLGGTMRLGARATQLHEREDGKTSLVSLVYPGHTRVLERHRHRYEVNPELVDKISAAGLFFSGTDDSGRRMEIVELDRDEHPFFFATQYHPEFLSGPLNPSPPFAGLICAAAGVLDE
eukprot:CAMPEP_0203821368 /NCGR_PEP_ID=MMETSP0115-20131106/42942_1 /ASSEMBLY_ACC=CAM_ASM_000227 /TAXON_ID=33651 /ORGANISM="Bicosoecid sp, Strain ms1" /LENGTH=558 /DNA_ID=CAMNT_0050730389 /DNA_START=39 /DNA_END=1712 /DNA_ORIENTATION=-